MNAKGGTVTVTPTAAGKKAPPGRPAAPARRGPTAPAKTAGARGAKPVPPPAAPAAPAAFRRARHTPLTPMRQAAAKSMSKLAEHIASDHPDMIVHQHVRDAARTLRSGNEEAAQRHLRAAMFSLTPQSLMRNGQHTDDAHTAARLAMHDVHRHLLLVKDIADVKERNQEAISRASYGDDTSAPQPPPPGAGYGPGALAAKPTARQPGGDRALNAPDRTNSGGPDPGAADPAGSKQFARTWSELAAVVDLAGHFNPLERRGKGGQWTGSSQLPGTEFGPHPLPLSPQARNQAARIISDHLGAGHGVTAEPMGGGKYRADGKVYEVGFHNGRAMSVREAEDAAGPGVRSFRSPSSGLDEAMGEKNAVDTLKAARSGRPVSRSRLATVGGGAAVSRLLASGLIKEHPTQAGKVTITPAGTRRLAAAMREEAAGPGIPSFRSPSRSPGLAYGWGDVAAVVDLGWTGWMRELRGRGGQWSDSGGIGATSPNLGGGGAQWTDSLDRPPDPDSLDSKAQAAAMAHPDVARLFSQSRAAHAAGDHQKGSQLWQQAVAMFNQKVQDYKDNSALDTYKPTAWEKAHPEEVAQRRMVQQQLTDSGGGDSYGGGPNGGMDELSNRQRAVELGWTGGTQAAGRGILLSAQTGRLAVTPAPYGKPGGPGLYHVKGLKHSDYLEQIVKALMSKRGMDKGRATAIARGSIRKWSRGGGHVHPEVRAAAGAAEAEELKAQARAHAHAATWDEVAAVVVELSWRDAYKTEERGKGGEWTGSLSGLADKLDGDHPGKGFGDEVRKAKDAAAAGDRDKAGEHLENAYGGVRSRAGEVGSKTAEGRKAAGNAFLLDQKMRQLQGGVTLARTWGDVVIDLHYSQDEPRNRHGEWAGIPGNMRGTPSMKMAQRAGLIKALGASQSADRSEKKRKLSMALHMKLAAAAHKRGDFTAEANHREQASQLATASLAWEDDVHQVRVAGALAGEKAGDAMAKTVHGHAYGWGDVVQVIELVTRPRMAGVYNLAAPPGQPRVPAGQAGGGQFGAAQGQPDAHQQHVAHMQHVAAQQGKGGTVGQQKASLSAKISTGQKQLSALKAQQAALQQALASASGKTSSGQSGSTTSSGASTTASSAPAAASTAAAGASTASSSTPSSSSSAGSTASAAQLTQQLGQVNQQITALTAQIAQWQKQASQL